MCMASKDSLSRRRRVRDTRLRRSADFAKVLAQRCRRSDAQLVVYLARNQLDYSRIGISVSRRVGNAVTRNRVRRVLREAFRCNFSDWPTGFDVVCIVKPAATADVGRLARALAELIAQTAKKAERGSANSKRRGN